MMKKGLIIPRRLVVWFKKKVLAKRVLSVIPAAATITAASAQSKGLTCSLVFKKDLAKKVPQNMVKPKVKRFSRSYRFPSVK
jgi:hypothetical protein